MCRAGSGTQRFLARGDERTEALEDRVDVSGERSGIEDIVEVDPSGELAVALDELAEVELLVPGTQGVALDPPVGIVAVEPARDEREQEPLAVDQATAQVEVLAHPPGMDDESLDEPRKRSSM